MQKLFDLKVRTKASETNKEVTLQKPSLLEIPSAAGKSRFATVWRDASRRTGFARFNCSRLVIRGDSFFVCRRRSSTSCEVEVSLGFAVLGFDLLEEGAHRVCNFWLLINLPANFLCK